MAWREVAIALIMVAGAAPVAASQSLENLPQGAPEAPADARYCMWVEAATGTRLETIQCWTRAEWAAMEIDVDQEWAQEGVRVIA